MKSAHCESIKLQSQVRSGITEGMAVFFGRLFFLFVLLPISLAFVDVHIVQPKNGQSISRVIHHDTTKNKNVFERHIIGRQVCCLQMIPLIKFDETFTFFREDDNYRCCIDTKGNFQSSDGDQNNSMSYQIGLVEEQDLPDLCKFVVSTFGADAISLSTNMNNFERMLLNPAAQLLNGYSSLVAFAEVYSGTKQRLADRLQNPLSTDISCPDLIDLKRQEKIYKAEKDSLILVLARPVTETPDYSKSLSSGNTIDIIASIELRLQPCDAKIPFSIPWLDRVERRLGTFIGLGTETGSADLQPYLSNLCVDETYRGKKIGRALVRCVENIAKSCWGYSRMYLHVDEDNLAALGLYKSEGYRDVGHRWNPFWSGQAAKIGYYVKSLTSIS